MPIATVAIPSDVFLTIAISDAIGADQPTRRDS